MKPMIDALAHILLYRSMGLAVIPIRYGGKEPLVKWGSYEQTPPSPREYEEWITKYWTPGANIGVLTGEASGNLVVVDFDDPEAYFKTFKPEIEKETIVVATGRGGRHVWLTTPNPIPSFKIPQLRIDVKSSGGYVVAPNSLHPSGRRYVFVNDTRKILEAPDIIESLLKKAGTLGIGKVEARPGGVKYRWRRHPPCIRKLLEGVPEGMRHDATIRLASYFINSRGMEVDEAIEILQKWNLRNKPPLSSRELKTNILSVAKGKYIFGCTGLSPFYCEREKCPYILKTRENMRETIGEIGVFYEARSVEDLLEEVRGNV
jgi:hypothetical protein